VLQVGSHRRGACAVNPRLLAVPLCVVLEGCAGLLVITESAPLLDMLAGFGLHVGASVLFGWTTGRSGTHATDKLTPVLSGLLALLGFPLFGMVAVLSGTIALSALALRPRRLQAGPTAAALAASAARPIAGAQTLQPDLFAVLDVEPIVDALNGLDPVLKQGAIDALVRSQRYQSVGTLRTLLLDPEAEIRLYASVTLTKLEDEIGQAMLDARAMTLDATPDAEAWETLAWVYVEYASSGFIAQPTADQYLDLARRAYEAAVDLEPDQSELALALGRAHLLFDQPEIAQTYFETAGMHHVRNPDVHLALMELAYHRGAVAEVAQRASTAARLLRFDYPQQQLVNWWAGLA